MANLKFKCGKCNDPFEIEVKNASFGRNGKLSIAEEIVCPKCGNLKNGEYLFPEEINKATVGELYFEHMKKEQIKRYMEKPRKEALNNYHPGEMFHYKDAFNQEELLTHIIDDKKYIMLDSYCVMPDCNCEDVALNFVDKENKSEVKTSAFSFLLNYETKNISKSKDIEKAKYIANSFTQETLRMLKDRHKKLKEELNDGIIEILKKYKRKIPEPPKRKIGRNEPCPCGSGIKYKKCCLGNN